MAVVLVLTKEEMYGRLPRHCSVLNAVTLGFDAPFATCHPPPDGWTKRVESSSATVQSAETQ